EVGTIFDILGVIGGVASVVTVGTSVARAHLEDLAKAGKGMPSWVTKLERTEKALHIHGRFGAMSQIFIIPYNLMEELDQIEQMGGEEGPRSARKALALLQAIRSGVVTIIQASAGEEGENEPKPSQKQLPEGFGAHEAGEHADGKGPAHPPITPGTGESGGPPQGEGGTQGKG